MFGALPALRYGPDGDLESEDPFEYAQARAREGWHIEGQMFRLPYVGWEMQATGLKQLGGERPMTAAIGYTKTLAAWNLLRKMY